MAPIRSILSLVTALTALFTSVSAAPTDLVARVPLLPDVDPFYQPPASFEAKEPGTILRQRTIAASFFGLVPDPIQAWQLLYRTTAINGSAISSVTTVFMPAGAKKDRFVSFHTAYDGSASSGACDPSYNYQLGATQLDLISSLEFLLLEAFILDGYIVSAPDYEGPDSAFGPGRLAGTGVLDSMRAVVNFKSTLGLTTDTPAVIGYGYSGGGIATGWAASLQPTYAPELNVKGWASGGTPANLTGTTEELDGTLFSGFLAQALVGLDTPTAYKTELQPVFDQILTPAGVSALTSASTICGVENLLTFPFQSIQSTEYNTLGDRVLYQSTVASILEQTVMGQAKNETPTAPVYLYHASQDEIIPYADASKLNDDWCGYGASVEFVTFANGGHLTTEVLGFIGAFEFVQSAFAGTVQSGCSKSSVLNSTLDPVALGVELEPVLVELLNGLAIVGKEDINIINHPAETLNKTLSN